MTVDRVRLLAAIQREAAETNRLLAGLTEWEAGQPARDDGWTIKDVVGHLADSHKGVLFWIGGSRLSAVRIAYDLDAMNRRRREARLGQPLRQVLADLETARQAVMSFTQHSPEDALRRKVAVPFLGDVTALHALSVVPRHEALHRAEIERFRQLSKS